MKKSLGIGRIQNGVMTFNGEVVERFSRPVVAPVVETVTEEVVTPITQYRKEVIQVDIPDFMKKAPRPIPAIEKEAKELVMGQLLQFKPKEEEPVEEDAQEEEYDPGKKMVDDVLKVIRRSRIFRYFFDEEEVE